MFNFLRPLMKKYWIGPLLSALVGLTTVFFFPKLHLSNPSRPESNPASPIKLNESYGRLPLYFEPNQGQTDPHVKFLSKGSDYNLFLSDKETALVLNHPN